MEIREATEADLPRILDIYNEVIQHSTAVWSEEPLTLESRQKWFRERVSMRFPVLVAVVDGVVAGFSSFGEFRHSPCYWPTVELTVHIHWDYRRQGLGRALVQALFPYAEAVGKRVMIAGVEAENIASLRLHEDLGFMRVARFQKIGFKFGRWMDLIFLQRWVAGEPGTEDRSETSSL